MKRQKVIQRMWVIPPGIKREGIGDQIAKPENEGDDALVLFRPLRKNDHQADHHKANGQGDEMLS
jgi:hypothetical protein